MLCQTFNELFSENPIGFFELVLFIIVDIAHFALGGHFIKEKNKFEVVGRQKIYLGYGFWFISIGFGHMVYTIDKTYRYFHSGDRIFATWNNHIINRQYILLALFFLYLAFAFLSGVIQRYLLHSSHKWMEYICYFMLVLIILMRWIESLAGELEEPGVVSTVVELAIYGVVLLIFLMILGFYIKIGTAAPKGSDLRKKALIIVFGIVMWVAMLLGVSNAIASSGLFEGVELVSPVIVLLILYMLKYGFSQEE